jgi:hypothetical protein
VIANPTDVLPDAEVAITAAGLALYLLGHVLFRLRMTGLLSWERLGGAACVLAGFAGTVVPALVLAALLVGVLVIVIAGERVIEARRRGRGEPSPLEHFEASAAAGGR